jgi:carboxyl-terminal processing protease
LAASHGDPYTAFLPPVENEIFESDVRGNFEGVGMEIGVRDGILTVISPIKGTPAYNAGVLPGDKIIKIDDTPTYDMKTDESVSLIRGKKGTTVTFTILREGLTEPLEIKVVRAVIDIPTIDTRLRSDGVFVIELYNFSANSPNLFRLALREFIDARTDKLLLDLRGNPGGYLEAAIDMASWFLSPGKIVVQEDFGQNEAEKIYRSSGYDIFNSKLKMVILVDGGSASASEILAGALQEHGIAKLVGDTTFGKGSVQELIPITNNTSLKVTIARWLTPSGLSISDAGIEPDEKVEVTPEDREAGKDRQMEKAVELLLNWGKNTE